MRSHTNQLGKMTTEYLETWDIASCLKAIIEGEDDVGTAYDLHFDKLQVPEKGIQYLDNKRLLHIPR